ncbi:MAG: hypothetical protein AB7I42_23995 [Bradyrhizobium sp.]|uniref:hypothetical protein n=1 Tax=Bradyrhizobium sp. TaxID=376 RepID=UPI003D0B650A
MAKKKDVEVDDPQGQLLDVSHPAAKEIQRIARAYKKTVKERMEVAKKELELKEKLRAEVKESGMKPDEDGVITFTCGKVTITVTPRDELVRVKDADAEEGD